MIGQDYTDLIADARVWPRDGVSKGPLINALADAIEALVKERDELAAVIEKMDSVGERLINSRGEEWVEFDAPEWDQVLSTAPADALAEHDARLIESLADAWCEWETFTASDGHNSIRQHGLSPDDWLRARAQQIREGGNW